MMRRRSFDGGGSFRPYSWRLMRRALPEAAVDRRAVLQASALLAALSVPTPWTRQSLAAQPGPPPATSFASEIAPGVHVHVGEVALANPENAGDHANMGFVIGKEAVAVIDTGGSNRVGMRLKEAVRATTDLPIRYVINTHMHPDHVLGNGAFEAEGTTFVAHHKMERGLAARAERYLAVYEEEMGSEAFAGTRVVLPTRGIDAPATLDLGGRILTLTPRPTAHTDNDLTVRDEETGTVFLGDLLFARHIPTIDGSIRGWMAVLDTLADETADRAVPGHGPASMPWPEAADPLRHYLQVIADGVREMIADNRTLSDAVGTVGLSEKDAWELFQDYNGRNVSAAFAELEWE